MPECEKFPPCYVCSGEIKAVPLLSRLKARRGRNVPVWILSPGVDKRYPDGLARHSYCAPGTDRWLASLGRSRKDRFYRRLYEGQVEGYWPPRGLWRGGCSCSLIAEGRRRAA